MKAFDAASARPLLNVSVFGGTRVHGIKPQPCSPSAQHVDAFGSRQGMAHASHLLALHGGCEICIAAVTFGENVKRATPQVRPHPRVLNLPARSLCEPCARR